jgi:membrane fusion protein, multidrug efflux system
MSAFQGLVRKLLAGLTSMTTSSAELQERHPPSFRVKLAIGAGTLVVVIIGCGLYARARAHVNNESLANRPKSVSVVEVLAGTFQSDRHYVATTEPWVMANVGPQLIAAFVDTVLVRPGDVARRGQILATLDCRDASASNRAVAAQARAIDAKQKALASEAARVNSLLDGGFAAPNEAEQKLAGSESELAELMATQAKLAGTSLAVNDCILRSPFDGEISTRFIDPGAFVRPGTAIVTVVDRSTVRVSAEVPEGDYGYVAPGTPVKVHMLATSVETSGIIARRSPAASDSTRTVHFEVDLPDPQRKYPVGTTAELGIKIGTPEAASIIPGIAASVREKSATVFIADGARARKVVVAVKGESLGTFYVDPSLKAGAHIITEGRSLLADGDSIVATLIPSSSEARPDSSGDKP